MSKLYFFRHAQASFGADNYDQLSKKGEEQSVKLGNYLVEKNYKFDKVFVGPLHRQQHTFEIVKSIYSKNNQSIPDPILINGLDEHVGHLAMDKILPQLLQSNSFYKEMAEKIANNPKRSRANRLLMFQKFMDEWVENKVQVDDVVSWSTFRKNVKEGVKTILSNTDSGETNAAFTSGGTISAITAEALKIDDEKRVAALNFTFRNTAFASFFYSRRAFNLSSFNELPHLRDDLITYV